MVDAELGNAVVGVLTDLPGGYLAENLGRLAQFHILPVKDTRRTKHGLVPYGAKDGLRSEFFVIGDSHRRQGKAAVTGGQMIGSRGVDDFHDGHGLDVVPVKHLPCRVVSALGGRSRVKVKNIEVCNAYKYLEK